MARAELNRNTLAEKAEMPIPTICNVYVRGTCKPATAGKIAKALGAGKVGRIYRGQIERLHYCDVVAWVDSNDRAYGALGVQNTEIVDLHLEFDYIVIAIYSKAVKDAIAEQLNQRGIPDDKIVWHDV